VADIPHVPPMPGRMRQWWERETRLPSGGSPIARIAQMWRRRDVFVLLVTRELKLKYEESILGYAWSLVEPLLLIGVYWLVFAHVARLHIPHYPLFVAAGMMPWLMFNGSLSSAVSSLKGNAGIIRTVNLPREIYGLAEIAAETIEYLLSLPVVFVVAAAYRVSPNLRFLALLPAAIVLEIFLVVGIGFLLSALNTLLRDVQRILRVVLRVLFYLSPVVYPTNRLHGAGAEIYTWNPLVGIIELNRAVFYPHQVRWSTLMTHLEHSVIGCAVLFVVGWALFMRLERPVLKEL
jgi:ABC-2 type transport system permease protein